MEQNVSAPEPEFFDALRHRRAELRESMSALEHALAAPTARDADRWTERVGAALVELSGDLREHVEITEGPEGLYTDLLSTAPRLTQPVAHLTLEHEKFKDAIEELLGRTHKPLADADMAELRHAGTDLLGALSRHRQRGADLVYEAYEVDVGGET